MEIEKLNLTQGWDKTFPQSPKVEHEKVAFHNRYGITLAADLYKPKGAQGPLAALAVSGPFGAVKEQASGLYAQTMAERGFLTIAFDPSFTGESAGEPRYMASPDINTEDFLAAVDYLSCRDDVDPNRVGIVGICGWGGLALNAAALDPRIKATVACTMYDMSRIACKGCFDANDSAAERMQQRRMFSAQRTEDYKAGSYKRAGGVVDPLPDGAPQFVEGYYAYYKTPRGYHVRSLNSNDGWTVVGTQSFLNQHLFDFAEEIENAVMVLHGDAAHSCYMGKDAFARLRGGNKELVLIPGASHTDLYDGGEKGAIPWERLQAFFEKNLA